MNAEKPHRFTSRQRECICKVADRDEFYIQCENCDQWYHGVCVFLTESIADHIKHWYCSSCDNVHKIVFNPKCSRLKCSDYQRSSSLYCSDSCGLNDAAAKFSFVFKSARHDVYDCSQLVKQRNRIKARIRFLESKQVFLDDCIERAQEFRNSRDTGSKERLRCGFDQRFLAFGKIEETQDDVNICIVDGKCSLHDGWELIKSQEVQLEMELQIAKYKQLKQKSIRHEYETKAIKEYMDRLNSQ